jgi:AcrR family transcriptional regulator
MARGTAQIPDAPADQRLLDIAATHVRRFGAAHVAIVRIAAEAGMSHANVYRYFPSKDALIDEITAAWLKPLEAELRVIGDGPDPPADKLERLLFAVHRAYRAKLDADPELFGLLVAAVAENRVVARKHRNRVQQEVQRTLEDGMSAGGFARADMRRAMALVFDMMHRFIHPASIRMDMDAPRGALEARASRVYAQLARALVAGRS